MSYFLIDCSAFMGIREREKAMQAARQANRALKLSKAKTALHIIGYNDKLNIGEYYSYININRSLYLFNDLII